MAVQGCGELEAWVAFGILEDDGEETDWKASREGRDQQRQRH